MIRCTFDGTQPTSTTAETKTPVIIKKNTAVQCFEFAGDSAVARRTETYFIDESVAMPIVAITVDPEFFDEYLTAPTCKPDPCYSGKFWDDVEFPTHVEYFAKGSSSPQKDFEIDAGIGISGGWSRNFEKRSVSVTMRKKYQDGRLKYPLFETRKENSKYKSFMLRNNGSRFVSDYIEDPMATSLLEGSGLDYQRNRQVVVFYNGQYHGIYDMREKLNEHFVESNHGIDSKTVDAIKHSDGTITASGGSTEGYVALMNFAVANDFSGEGNGNYEAIGKMIDRGNFADYMAAQFYYHNGDWPNNNVRAWRASGGPWKFMVFDLDHGFDWMWMANAFTEDRNMFDWMREGGGETNCRENPSPECFHNLFLKVYENPDFKRMFANRAAIMYTTWLTSDRVKSAVDSMVALIPKSEIDRDMALYPRDRYWYRNSCGSGFETDGYCLKKWAVARDKSVREDFYSEYGFTGDIIVTLSAQGGGRILVEGKELPSANYTGKFFEGSKILLAAESETASFVEWEDGSTENPRLVTPAEGDIFTAKFK